MNTKLNRRGFLKAAGITSIFLLPVISGRNAFAEGRGGAAPAGAMPMLSETDPTAVALGYKSDAKKVDVVKFPKRAGAEGGKQFCYNCQFYQFTGSDSKSSKSAPCQLFPGKSVASKGWCNSWAQNPKVKG